MATLTKTKKKSKRLLYRQNKIGHYTVNNFISQGLYTQCYNVTDDRDLQTYCLKVGLKKDIKESFKKELGILIDINHTGCAYFPGIRDAVVQHHRQYCFFAMQLGKSKNLSDEIKQKSSRHYTVSETVPILIELLYGIEELHGSGWVHRDIKPSNIVNPVNAKWQHNCWIIDFGEATECDTTESKFCGTSKFSSIHVHEKKPYTTHDDLKSIFYIGLEMIQILPWSEICEENEGKAKREKAYELKIKFNQWVRNRDSDTGDLFANIPNIFRQLFNVVNNNTNDCIYDEIRRLLRRVIVEPANSHKFSK